MGTQKEGLHTEGLWRNGEQVGVSSEANKEALKGFKEARERVSFVFCRDFSDSSWNRAEGNRNKERKVR